MGKMVFKWGEPSHILRPRKKALAHFRSHTEGEEDLNPESFSRALGLLTFLREEPAFIDALMDVARDSTVSDTSDADTAEDSPEKALSLEKALPILNIIDSGGIGTGPHQGRLTGSVSEEDIEDAVLYLKTQLQSAESREKLAKRLKWIYETFYHPEKYDAPDLHTGF